MLLQIKYIILTAYFFFKNVVMSTKKAFTLVELLVVIIIIALLVSIQMPALSKARKRAKKVVCLTNMHCFSQACIAYTGDHDDWFPVLRQPQSDIPWALADPGATPDSRGVWAPYLGYKIESGSDVLYCPSLPLRRDDPYMWDLPFPVITYCYFSGYKISSTTSDNLNSRPGEPPAHFLWTSYYDIPTKVGLTNPQSTLMGDQVYRLGIDEGYIYNHGKDTSITQNKFFNYAGIILGGGLAPMDLEPEGANLALADGSARWDDFQEMELAIPMVLNRQGGWYWGIPEKGGDMNPISHQ